MRTVVAFLERKATGLFNRLLTERHKVERAAKMLGLSHWASIILNTETARRFGWAGRGAHAAREEGEQLAFF